MTSDWLTDRNKAIERLERIIKDRMIAAMERSSKLQREIGKELGWDEAKVSKTLGMGSTRRMPTEVDIRNWARVTGESDESRDETLAILADLKSTRKSWKERIRAGRDVVQNQYLRLYAETSHFRILQTAAIPGVLQIPEYARQVFVDLDADFPGAIPNVDAAVEARMARAGHLYNLDKAFEILVTEGALRLGLADPLVMRAQLDRLISATSMTNVRFGIIPQMVRIHRSPSLGFVIFDEVAVVETPAGDENYRDEELKPYVEGFARHWHDALEGDAARELIRKVMSEYPTK